ncbi:tetratricopeptide repeat protein 31-like isoform X3 [Girardinichthys multiradiatus]|nr:tetratricopeptide repeat protein 31-like isoform X3 [Girardinichthys multiradiatus]
MIQKVVGLFGNQPQMQRIITCGLLGLEYDAEIDVDDYDRWTHRSHSFNEGFANDRLSGNRTEASSSAYQPPLHYYSSARGASSPPSYQVQAKGSDSERKARLLQETKKGKEKSTKKRLKKQKQKLKKQMEKVKQNPVKTEEGNVAEQSKSEESNSVTDQKIKNLAAAKDTDSNSSNSGQESSDEDEDTKNNSDGLEELDMTSIFVSKAALIVQRKLEQKPKSEKKDKKKTPEREKFKSVPDKTPEDKEAVKGAQHKQDSGPTLEDNIKISTDLAVIGNKFASAGDYSMAVKYFTDAIKYNPKEFKLFGNRSFCFEKMQEYEKALADAELSLNVSPGWVKGLFRKGRALAGLKRYEEAADAFRDVLKRDSSYAEAAQELMRMQIIQLMAYGFTREQSSNALIIHGTVDKALEVLSKLHHPPGSVLNGPLPPAQVANVTGISPVLSANTHPAPVAAAQSYEASEKHLRNKPLGPVQNIPTVDNQSKPAYNQSVKINTSDRTPVELFPVWVGNLSAPVTEAMISKLFSRAGSVFSVKLLSLRRCAFVNFTKQEHCDEAIRCLHGYDLHGIKIAVRYPDRIPPGMGISRSALRARDLQEENLRQYSDGKKAV